MFPWKRSTFLSVFVWDSVFFTVLMAGLLQDTAENTEVDCGPFLVGTVDGTPKLAMQCSMKLVGVLGDVVFVF